MYVIFCINLAYTYGMTQLLLKKFVFTASYFMCCQKGSCLSFLISSLQRIFVYNIYRDNFSSWKMTCLMS